MQTMAQAKLVNHTLWAPGGQTWFSGRSVPFQPHCRVPERPWTPSPHLPPASAPQVSNERNFRLSQEPCDKVPGRHVIHQSIINHNCLGSSFCPHPENSSQIRTYFNHSKRKLSKTQAHITFGIFCPKEHETNENKWNWYVKQSPVIEAKMNSPRSFPFSNVYTFSWEHSGIISLKNYSFVWLNQVFVAACRILQYVNSWLWHVRSVPWPGLRPGLPARAES